MTATNYGLSEPAGVYCRVPRAWRRGALSHPHEPYIATLNDPKIVGRTPGTTDAVGVTNAQYYDVLGRRYFLAVQLDF